MAYRSYQDVQRLDSSALGGLLGTGDPQERVWAAWELGLRIGGDAVPRLAEQATGAPDSGTRRHVIVVLAGLGQQTILSTLARHDPDESVRATSCQYILGTLGGHDGQSLAAMLAILREDPSPEVKRTILVRWKDEHGRIPVDVLFSSAVNEDEDVRQAAIQYLRRHYSPRDLPRGRLANILAEQSTTDAIQELASWLLKSRLLAPVIQAAEVAGLSGKLAILDVLVSRKRRLPWSQLKALADEGEASIDIRLLSLVEDDFVHDLLFWLARGIARALRLPEAASSAQYQAQKDASDFGYLALPRFLDLAAAMPRKPLPTLDRKNFETIYSKFHNEVEELVGERDRVIPGTEELWREWWRDEEGVEFDDYLMERQNHSALLRSWIASA